MLVSPPPPPIQAPRAAVPDALAAALGEERVTLASGVRIEGIDTDRPWVCAGETLGLNARVGNVREPGAVSRWVWLTGGGGAELQPGPSLQWRPPATPGRHLLHFQVCRDLGGRRVGVLAEQVIEVEVRRCGEGEGEDEALLQINVVQRGHGTFLFQALYQGQGRLSGYSWDFGDGVTETTTGPEVTHTYAVERLGPQEVKSFTVRLEARPERGAPLPATAFAVTRGRGPTYDPPPVELAISRWRPRPEGGWQSELAIRTPEGADITWERLERLRLRWDEGVDVSTRPWSDVVIIEERLERGGFRGHVTVSAEEASPEVKQILDFLHGRDATGKEVTISWSPFKREAPPARRDPGEDLRK